MDHARDIRTNRARGGFTLIESVVTMVILAIIMVMVSRLFLAASMGYTSAAERGELHVAVSCAMDRLATELRNTRVKSGASPACADITSTTPASIQWVDPDGSSRAVSLSGSDLLYSVGGATGAVLASNVSSFAVATFDESNTALSTSLSGSGTNSIRRIQITLVGSHAGVTDTLRTRVFPRACMTNWIRTGGGNNTPAGRPLGSRRRPVRNGWRSSVLVLRPAHKGGPGQADGAVLKTKTTSEERP